MATAKSTRKIASPATKKDAASPAKTTAKASIKTSVKAAVDSGTAGAKPQQAPTAAPKNATIKPVTVKAEKKKDKPEKVKVLRDSFTIPKSEFAQIAALKKRAMALGQEVKKSELIRAGLLLLGNQNDASLLKALAAVPTLKTGRPGKA